MVYDFSKCSQIVACRVDTAPQVLLLWASRHVYGKVLRIGVSRDKVHWQLIVVAILQKIADPNRKPGIEKGSNGFPDACAFRIASGSILKLLVAGPPTRNCGSIAFMV